MIITAHGNAISPEHKCIDQGTCKAQPAWHDTFWPGHPVTGNCYFAVTWFFLWNVQKIMSQLSPAGNVQKNHVTAPEPGQHHAKSREIPLQVHFSTSTLLQKIMSRHCSKNPDMAIGPILPKKIMSQLSWAGHVQNKSCHSSGGWPSLAIAVTWFVLF